MKQIIFFISSLMLLCLFGCDRQWDTPTERMGLRPVYGTPADLEVRKQPPQEMCQPGKIYIYGSYLLVNEVHKGIHIIDNSDPEKPQNLAFLKITGNADMAVKNGYLYADHLTSMVVIDIREPQNAKFIKSVAHTFDPSHSFYPPETGVHFECVDPEKGTVIGWKEALLKDPKCFR